MFHFDVPAALGAPCSHLVARQVSTLVETLDMDMDEGIVRDTRALLCTSTSPAPRINGPEGLPPSLPPRPRPRLRTGTTAQAPSRNHSPGTSLPGLHNPLPSLLFRILRKNVTNRITKSAESRHSLPPNCPTGSKGPRGVARVSREGFDSACFFFSHSFRAPFPLHYSLRAATTGTHIARSSECSAYAPGRRGVAMT